MGVGEFIDFVERQHTELVLFNLDPEDDIADALECALETWNVTVRTARTASGAPRNVAVLSTEQEVLSIVGIATLRCLVEKPAPGTGESHSAVAEYRETVKHLKETTFTSYDSEQLLYASREIEDRARRVGGGTLYAGFQRVSTIADEQPVYTDLSRQGVTVHAFGVPDTAPPDIGAGRVHTIDTDEIERSWFVVFDGGGEQTQKSALLAEQRAENEYFGTWTYDPGFVDRVIEYFERRYLETREEHESHR